MKNSADQGGCYPQKRKADFQIQIFIVLHYLQNYNITTFTKITSDKEIYITLNNQNKCAQ